MGLLIMSLTFEKMRELVADIGDDFVDEDEARWMEQTEDVENDVFSLCLGFLLMQTIRRSITGRIEPHDVAVAPTHINQWQTNTLLLWSVAASVATFALTCAVNRISRWSDTRWAM